jgi:hypothetical protein
MIEWSWRVEKPRSIQSGSWSSERRITAGVRALKGRRIADLTVEGRLPELNLRLDAGVWVHSFATAEGQPQWTLFLRNGSWITVERGRLVHDQQNVRHRRASA